jgi:outer membrane biogenesis lipoprotein LolB
MKVKILLLPAAIAILLASCSDSTSQPSSEPVVTSGNTEKEQIENTESYKKINQNKDCYIHRAACREEAEIRESENRRR